MGAGQCCSGSWMGWFTVLHTAPYLLVWAWLEGKGWGWDLGSYNHTGQGQASTPVLKGGCGRCLLAVLAPSSWGSGGWEPKQMDPVVCGREVLHKIHHQLVCFARSTVTQINQSLKRIRRCFIHQLLPSLELPVLSWMVYLPRKAANFDFHTFLP